MMLLWLLLPFLLFPLLLLAGLALFTAWVSFQALRLVPRAGQLMTVGDQTIHYTDTGQGRPIVMIHGLGGTLINFSYALARRLVPDHRVVLIDRPGSGYSVRPADAPANLRAQAATIAEVMQRLGLDRPLVVGHSLGGALALALALDHPAQVGGLVLLSPLTQATSELPPAFRALAIRSRLLRVLIAWTIAAPLAIRSGRQVLGYVFGPDPIPEDFPMKGGGLLGLRPVSYLNTSADLLAVNDDLPGLMQRYGELAMPVAMLYGRGDQILDVRLQGEPMRRAVPGLDLEVIDGGHMLPVVHPQACEAIIRRTESRMAGR
jgi:pimeloyl-ACP methyl ester carboxylesterase